MATKSLEKKKDKNSVLPTASKTAGGLSLDQESFCKLYTNSESIDRDLFGNGTQCYLSVYGEAYFDKYKKPMNPVHAMSLASRLLRNVKVIDRINKLLEEGGFNDNNVDKQHLFLLNQHADLKTKLGAIREYNSLKKRINRDPQNVFNTLIISDEQTKRIASRIIGRTQNGSNPSEESPD